MIRRLLDWVLDPMAWLRTLNDFLDGLLQARGSRMGGENVYATITCPCGQRWVQARPNHYGGAAGYPLRCPACDGAGKLLETGVEKVWDSPIGTVS